MKARCFAGLLVLFCRASSLALTSSPVRPPLMRASVAPLRASPSIKASAAALKPLTVLRGGGLAAPEGFAALAATPASTFNAVFIALCAVAVASRLGSLVKMATSKGSGEAPTSQGLAARALQMRFLPVFWLLRMADWLQGPYFYEVYASKVFNGAPASLSLVSKLFLTGFGATALFGPAVGRLTDQSGRKLGTLAFAAFYTVGALTTRSPLLWVLLLGRLAGAPLRTHTAAPEPLCTLARTHAPRPAHCAAGGIGTSLLFSAPEAWLVGEAQRTDASAALGDTFGLACAARPPPAAPYRLRLRLHRHRLGAQLLLHRHHDLHRPRRLHRRQVRGRRAGGDHRGPARHARRGRARPVGPVRAVGGLSCGGRAAGGPHVAGATSPDLARSPACARATSRASPVAGEQGGGRRRQEGRRHHPRGGARRHVRL